MPVKTHFRVTYLYSLKCGDCGDLGCQKDGDFDPQLGPKCPKCSGGNLEVLAERVLHEAE